MPQNLDFSFEELNKVLFKLFWEGGGGELVSEYGYAFGTW